MTINSGETSGAVTFNATQDTEEDRGESIQLSFGTPPQGVTASGAITTTVTILDDDPEVTVQFGSASYPVAEGDSVDVTVTLSADAKRTVVIPLAATAQGATSSSDYTEPVSSVTFDAGETSRTVRVSITEDTTNDDGESVVLSFGADLPLGVSEGATNETTVTIIEDDPPVTVSFGAATYAVDEGGSVSVSVTLSADPQRTVVIPITAGGLGGGSSDDYTLAASVTFTSGDTTQTVSFSATEDIIDDDDESIRLAFGTLPPGVTGSGATTTTVSINDNDDPEVTVQFGSATYGFAEGGGVTVTVKLDPDPERTVTIPLSTTYGGGATSADFSGIPGSLTFDSGITSKTFRVTAVDDFIDNDGRTATVGFGAMLPARIGPGTTNETVVTITDTETRGVGVFPTALTIVEEQSETTTYTLTMRTRPSAPVTITINYPTDNADATVDPASLTFDESNWTTLRTVTVAPTPDNKDEPTETVTITHTISGGDYGANNVTVSDVVVTITDNDASPVIIGSAARSFDEIEYDHSNPAEFDREVAIFSATDADDTQTGDWVMDGPDRLQFFIEENDEGKGVLSFRSPPDFENPTDSGSDNTYEVTLSVTDGTNIGTLDVIVTVANVNETPTFSIGSLETSREEIPYTRQDLVPGDDYRLLGIVSASDEEGNAITWSVGGDDSAAFNIMTIADRGYLRLDISPDFEDPADDDEDNTYDIIIVASDGTNVAEVPYTLTITGVNEPPLIHDFTIPDYTEIEHDFTGAPPVVHTFTATDYEGDTIFWFLQSGDADDFNLDTSGPAGKAVLQFLQDGRRRPPAGLREPARRRLRQRVFVRRARRRLQPPGNRTIGRHGQGHQRERKAGVHGRPDHHHRQGRKRGGERRPCDLRRPR